MLQQKIRFIANCVLLIGYIQLADLTTLTSAIGQDTISSKHELEWEIGPTGSKASFRGLSTPTAATVWLCGSQSTVLRSIDGGSSWLNCSPTFGDLEFRSIVAQSESKACIASAGTPAVILRTEDGGKSWQEAYRNQSTSAFFDGMKFWNQRQGIAFSDPVEGKFLIVQTDDSGRSWQSIPPEILPEVLDGEAAFAASNSSLLIAPGGQVWIGTGGSQQSASRILYRQSWQADWQIQSAPIPSSPTSGLFSLAMTPVTAVENGASGEQQGQRSPPFIVAVGGDYRPGESSPVVCVWSNDHGQSWQRASLPPKEFRSAVTAVNLAAEPSIPQQSQTLWITVGPTGGDFSLDGDNWREFSKHGFHVLSSHQNQVFAAGSNGKFAKLRIKPILP